MQNIQAEGGEHPVLATNLPRSTLKRAGLDHESLLQRMPGIVYGLVTPFGLNVDATDVPARGEVGAWYALFHHLLCFEFSGSRSFHDHLSSA